ncbi:head-tail adaptor [Mycobacterium phage Lolly9]|uniref:Head-to-tail stopper n=1 Tax=Mycobacterium phage Lolly9 TaxID=1698711 RepID=A0A0K2FN66_9CAUD|nr:head-tail adaptor [Mycobacterium phage Lolly9]ALA48429.1 head-to-tail stopper [Mycobacterium phage Lolly9]QOP65741.1 head-to-tail stopper [Mycobacterium phage MiniLon]QOP66486.1 head-to-tail stopper [Mycobacterium phage MiniMac]
MNEETLTVTRGDTDKYGNPNKEAHGTVKGIFAWGPGTSTNKFGRDRNFKGESNSLTAELYVKRGSDLKARDRVQRANGELYAVVGHAAWDQNDPFGGYDFGYMVFQVEAVNA